MGPHATTETSKAPGTSPGAATPRLTDVIAAAEALWPPELAQDWDVVGLAAGDREQPVRRILLALDPCDATIDEAIRLRADLLFTHHPLLLRGVTSVAADTLKGGQLTTLIRHGISQYNAHTNADAAIGGVNDVLIEALGVRDARPLEDPGAPEPGTGIGRIGDLPATTTLRAFAEAAADALPATVQGLRVAGDPELPVRRVAVCSGAGDSLFGLVRGTDADVYLTSDLRHHPAAEALDTAARRPHGGRPALIDTAHWASESIWLPRAAQQLHRQLQAQGFEVETVVSDASSDPWAFRVHQNT